MKKIAIFLILISPFIAYCQSGVYLTEADFKKGKVSVEGEIANVVMAFGKYTIVIEVSGEKKKYVAKDIWGFRRKHDAVYTDYRVIDGIPAAIASKGEIYFYEGPRDYLEEKDGKIIFHKFERNYPHASRGLDGNMEVIKSYKSLFDFIHASPDFIKEAKKGKYGSLMIQIGDYYNSTRPGFQGKAISEVDQTISPGHM